MGCVEHVISIANCLGTPVCKYMKYHIKLNDYVTNFKRTKDEVNCKLEDIELQLRAELLHPVGKIPKKAVENWLEKGKAMISEAQDVEDKVCTGGYLCRAWTGELVDAKTQEMQKFIDKAPNASETLVIDGPCAGLPMPTSELVGEKAVREEIWQCLIQEEVSKVGVWGMGGVGKTTIMKHIHNDLLKEHRFERVIWVTISKQFNVVKLQDDISSALNLKEDLAKEEDNLRRASILSEMLNKAGKYVLILDDVWDEVSLEDVGIPEPSGCNGCKLVLTTRSEQVCNYIDCKVIIVKHLSEEEALILFLNKVGPNIVHSPTLMPTLRLVVKECAGLPLTIVVVACTLKRVNEPRIWKNALKELKERIGKVEGAEAKVIERLKVSFDHLKDQQLQHCFLYCALYPEDFEIKKHELMECWIDEGFIDEMDTREEMKDKGYAVMKRLEDNCLLENAPTQYPCVKMHDAVRDMALSITSMNPLYMIRAGLQLKKLPKEEEWTENIEKVSLMVNSVSEIPMSILPPKCQLLTTLLLQENPVKRIPNSFFANMPCLSVLNLSSTEIESLPSSVSELTNLTALLLGYCRYLRYVPDLSKLQGLKKLDLGDTMIEEVPEGMEMLINLRYLDLSICNLKGIPVGLLPKLSHLQHLRFYLSKKKTSLKAEEIVPLDLEIFFGRFEDMHELNKFVSSTELCKKNMVEYQLQVGPSSYWSSERGKVVSINGPDFCGGKIIMFPSDVQQLEIFDCHEIEFLASFSSSSSCTHPFQSLELLFLHNLPKLSELVKDGLAPSATFSHLEVIIMQNCSSMKTLLPHWLLPSLQNLKKLEANECDELVEIFGAPILENEGKRIVSLIKIHLPKLRDLILYELPKLESICDKSGAMICDSVELIEVIGCYELKRIPLFVSLDGNEQPYAYAPPCLKIISEKYWWEEFLEWDDPNFKNVLQPHWEQKQFYIRDSYLPFSLRF